MFCKPRGLTLRSSYTLRVISDSGTIEVEVSKNTTFWEENNFFIVSLTSENLPDIPWYFCQVDSLYFFMARVWNVISSILPQMDTIPEGEYVDLNENNGGFCSGSGSTKPSTATSSPMVACILFFSSTIHSPQKPLIIFLQSTSTTLAPIVQTTTMPPTSSRWCSTWYTMYFGGYKNDYDNDDDQRMTQATLLLPTLTVLLLTVSFPIHITVVGLHLNCCDKLICFHFTSFSRLSKVCEVRSGRSLPYGLQWGALLWPGG